MKNSNITSRIILLIILLLSVKISGCEQEDLDFSIDCDYCLDEYPLYDTVYVYISINDENSSVALSFYLGDYYDGKETLLDTVSHEEVFALPAKVDVEYSVRASYKNDDKTIIAVDGDKMRVVNGEDECYSPCYYIRGGTLDVKLPK